MKRNFIEKVHQNDIKSKRGKVCPSYISFPSKFHQNVHRNNTDFFVHRNQVDTTSKRRRYLAYQYYLEQSTSKRRRSFAHRNSIKESKSKNSIFRFSKLHQTKYVETTSFFAHRNYIKKIRQNNVEIH